MGRFADILGTLGTSFGIGPKASRAVLDASALTAPRTHALPDKSGTLALTSDMAAYLPLAGGTLSGALSLTASGFPNSSIGFVNGGTAPIFWIGNRNVSSGDANYWTVALSATYSPANDVLRVTSLGNVISQGVRIPRIFVQSTDPGAAAEDGDLWIW